MGWFSELSEGAGSALGAGIGGLFGYKGAKEQNIASAQQAQNQMDFQERMSNTAIQRRMADLKKGGLNPILAGKFDASSPSGAMAPQFNKAQAALSNLGTASNIANTIAQTRLTDNKTGMSGSAALLGEWLENIMEKLGFDPDSERNITNASNISNTNNKGQVAFSLDQGQTWTDNKGKKWTDKELTAYLKNKFPNGGF
jgi:hypothetical protein